VQFATDQKGAVTGINVSINSNTLSGVNASNTSGAFAHAIADVAHEGSHVQTDQALIDHHMDPAYDVTNRRSEWSAYAVSNSVMHSLGWTYVDASGTPINLNSHRAIDDFLNSQPPEGQEKLDGPIYTPPQ